MMQMLFQGMDALPPVRLSQDILAMGEEWGPVDLTAETESKKQLKLVMTETTLIMMAVLMIALLNPDTYVQHLVPPCVEIQQQKELKHVMTATQLQETDAIVPVKLR